MFAATGNNVVIAGDLTARAIVCTLDPECERPEERRFKLNLHEWVPAHRGELVAAALTIVRAYLAAGEPQKGKLPNFARFEDWSRFVREPLVWLGMADPCLTRKRIEEQRPYPGAADRAFSRHGPRCSRPRRHRSRGDQRALRRRPPTPAPLEPVEHVNPALREAVYAIAEERGRINPAAARQLYRFSCRSR